VVLGGDGRPLDARALSDGTRLWSTSVALHHLTLADGRIFGLDERSVHAIDERTGALSWTASADSPLRYLSAGAGQVIVASDSALRSLHAEDGRERWHVGLDAPPATAAAIGPDVLAMGLRNGTVVAFDSATGGVRWRTMLDEPAQMVSLAGDRVIVGLPTIAACALGASGGRIDWCTYRLRVPFVGRPAVDGDRIYLALLDGTFRALDRRTGTLLRSDQLRGRPASGPVSIGGDLAVPLTNNAFVLLSPSSGRLTRVDPPPAAPLLSRAAILGAPPVLVTLSTSLRHSMTLAVYTPAVPAAPSASPAAAAPLASPGGPANTSPGADPPSTPQAPP
jgi:outer membrane protein assembly factor BamB